MVEQLPSQNHPEILPGRPRFADQLPAMLICSVLMAIAVGIAGWSGLGMIGKWAGPGIGGLLVGAVTGFSFPLLVCVSMYWGLSWLAFSRTKAIPYAAMSETSSNRWKLSVISDFSFSA